MRARHAAIALGIGLTLLGSSIGSADSLFEVDVDTDPAIHSESNSIVDLVDDFIDQNGDFDSLLGQTQYEGTFSYLGIERAIVLKVQDVDVTMMIIEASVILTFPTTGFTQEFTGTDLDDVEQKIEDFIQESATEWGRFLQSANGLSPLAFLSGNPKSTVALMGNSAYRKFGIDDSRSRFGFDEEVTRFGGFGLRLGVGASSISTGPFEDLWATEFDLVLAGQFGSTVGMSLAILGQYRDYQGAQSYDIGLELAVPVTIWRPVKAKPYFWQLTPFFQAAGGASIDLAAGGLFLGGGLVNSIAVQQGPFEFLMANEISYYGGIPISNIGDYDFETELSQLVFKNGLEATWYPLSWLYVDAGMTFTNFALDAAAVSWYATPTIGIGMKAGRWLDVRIGYEGDYSTDYSASGGRIKLHFLF